MPFRPISMPHGGLGEGAASSEQQTGTYPSGVNVRGEDPRTGQMRMASREGLVRVGLGPATERGDAVTSIHRVGEHSPTSEWVALSETEEAGVVPPAVEELSTADLPARAVSMVAAPNGDRFCLLEDGSVQVLNADDALVETIRAPAPGGFELVRRIQLDDGGGVVIAWRTPATREDIAGQVFRMRRSVDETWDVHYTLSFAGSVVDFVASRGELFVAQHRPDDVTEGPLAYVSRISGALTPAATEAWARVAAYPIGGIAARSDGSMAVASEPNAERSGGNTPAPTEPPWNPRRPVPGSYDPDTELMWWTSAARFAQSSPGNTAIDVWQGELETPSQYSTPVHTGAREFVRDTNRQEITLVADAGRGHPGIRFSPVGPSLMRSPQVVSRREKNVPEDDAAWHRIPFPGMRTAGEKGHTWALAMHFTPRVFSASVEKQTVFRLGDNDLGLTVKWLGGSWEFQFYASYDTTPPDAPWRDLGGGESDFSQVFAGAAEDTPFLVTIVFAGAGEEGSQLRVNGEAIWEGTFDSHFAELNQTVDIGYDVTGVNDHFGGHMHEFLGLFGPTDVLPHDTAVPLDTIERLEAWIAYTYEFNSELDSQHGYFANPPGVTGSGPLGPGEVGGGLGLENPLGMLVMFDLAGNAKWIGTGSRYGSAVEFGLEDDVFTAGYEADPPPNVFHTPMIARVQDGGDEVIETGEDTWTVMGRVSERWRRPVRLFHDGCGGLVVPRYTLGSGTTVRRLEYYERDGTRRFGFDTPSGRIVEVCALGTRVDLEELGGPCGPEILGAIFEAAPYARQLAVLGRKRTGATTSRRISTFATTARGSLSQIDVKDGAVWLPPHAASLPGPRPWALTVYPLTMFGDGRSSYYVYDARTRHVRVYAGSSRGALPRRCEFGVSYRGRAVLGGGDERSEINYSKLGDITDWDSDPAVVTAEQAVTQAQARARRFPDLVRGLRAWSDDLMIVFCDGSVWRQTGDPMLGGQSDQIVRDVGLADTWAHALDPYGAIYFFATDGHVYRMGPDGNRQSIVEGRVHQRFLDLDLRRYRPELQWDPVHDGLWLVVIPRGAPEEGIEHYFWSRALGAWHPTRFAGGVDRCVTAIGMQDGDGPSDAAVLFGFADGTVRQTTRFAFDDDGVPIRWQLLIGPIFARGERTDVKMSAVEVVLAHGSEPAYVGGYASPVADVLGPASGTRRVEAGRGLRVPTRTRGSSLWIGIGGVGQCAIEELSAQFSKGGAKQRTHKRVT